MSWGRNEKAKVWWVVKVVRVGLMSWYDQEKVINQEERWGRWNKSGNWFQRQGDAYRNKSRAASCTVQQGWWVTAAKGWKEINLYKYWVVLKSLEVIISKNLICHDNNNKLNIAHCCFRSAIWFRSAIPIPKPNPNPTPIPVPNPTANHNPNETESLTLSQPTLSLTPVQRSI